MRFEKWQALGNDYLILEAGLAALGAERGAGRAALRPALRGRLRRGPAALAQRATRVRRRAADLQPGRLRGRALRQRRPRGDPLPAPPRLDRRGHLHDRDRGRADRRRRSPRSGPARWRWAAPRPPPRTSRRGDADGRGTLTAGGREWAFQHVSIGNPQCAIVVGRRAREPRPGRDRARDRKPRAVPEPDQRLLLPGARGVDGSRVRARIFERGVGETLSSGTGASGAAVAAYLAGSPSPITVELDGGELEVEISEDLDVRLTGWAEPVCSRRALARAGGRAGAARVKSPPGGYP